MHSIRPVAFSRRNQFETENRMESLHPVIFLRYPTFSPQPVDNNQQQEEQDTTADTGKINPDIGHLCTAVIEQLDAFIGQGTQQAKQQAMEYGMDRQLPADTA